MISPFNDLGLTGAGFVPIAQTVSLYTHQRYPGFLFKKVATLEQALACGGVFLQSTRKNLIYLGLDMERAYHAGKLGQHGVPSKYTRLPAEQIRAANRYKNNAYPTEEITFHASFFKLYDEVWTADTGDFSFVGIVTRVDEGFVLDYRDANVNPTINVAYVRDPITVPYGELTGGNVVGSAGRYVYPSGSDSVSVRTKGCSGYISNNIPVDAVAFLKSARAGFIAAMDAEQEVRDAYDQAYGEYVDAFPSDSLVHDAISWYPVLVTVGGVVTVQWRHERPRYAPVQGELGTALRRYKTVPTTDPEQKTGETADSYGMVLVQHSRSYNGIPFPGFKVSILSGTVVPLVSGVDDPYPLTAVPYADVKVYQGPTIKAAAVWPVIGPKVAPAADAVATLDRSGSLEESIKDYISKENSSGSITGAADAAKLSESEDGRARDYATMKEYVPSFTAFVQATISVVSARAKDILKG